MVSELPTEEEIHAQGEKGRILAEAIAKATRRSPVTTAAMGVVGRFIGRRLAKGYPLISFEGEERPPQPRKKRARKKASTKASTKALTKKKRSRKKP